MNRRVKNITGHPAPSSDALARSAEYQARYGSLDSIEFPNSASLVFLMEEPRKWLAVGTQLEVFLGPKKVGTFEVQTLMEPEPET